MSRPAFKKEDVVGLECVYATYCTDRNTDSDALVVKEKIHLKDGTTIPNIRIFKDHLWDFYITQKGHRNHQLDKESEEIGKLKRFESTRIRMPRAIARALDTYCVTNSVREMSKSPYLYGTDIKPVSLIRDVYAKRYPNLTPTRTFTVAGLDLETDVVDGTGEVIMANIAMKGKSYTAVTRKFARNNPNFPEEVKKAIKKLVGKEVEGWDIVIEVKDTPGDCCWEVLQIAHQWKPDYISIWNMKFDIPKMMEALERDGYNLADAFSDPKVPQQFRFFRWKEGPAIKVTQSGEKMSLHHADRWHSVFCPAGFYFIDAMCLYKRIRTAKGNDPSYALNAILEKEGLPVKLSIKETEHLQDDGDMWHLEMQKYYPVYYTVYNFIDDKRLLDLDDKTGDISRAFPALNGISDHSDYNKNPRRIADDLHFFYKERGEIIASTNPDARTVDPLDKYIPSLKDWIITLPAYMIQSGIPLFKDAPHIRTMIFQYLSDLDIEGTYPNEELFLNISKKTTLLETCQFKGMTEWERRKFTLDLTGGKSNALELCIRYLGYPTPQEFLKDYREFKKGKVNETEHKDAA